MVEDCRWSNPTEWEKYAAYVGRVQHHDQSVSSAKPDRPKQQKLSVPEQMEEFMFLGLRMMCGIEKEAFGRKFGQQIEAIYGPVLQNLEKQGLLMQDQNRVWLTERGIDISNYVMAQFLFG